MRNKRLNTNIKIKMSVIPSVGAATGMTELEVDCTGFKRVMYVLITGAAAAGATIAFKVGDAVATGGGGLTDIASAASAGLTAAANASKIHLYDIAVNPARPFQTATGVVGTDTFANAIIAILYNPDATLSFPLATAYATELVVVA